MKTLALSSALKSSLRISCGMYLHTAASYAFQSCQTARCESLSMDQVQKGFSQMSEACHVSCR